MKSIFCFFKDLILRFLPGLVLAVILMSAYKLNEAFKLFGTEAEYRRINGFHYAESALRKTGLEGCAYDAANTSIYYDTYARDGESLTVFVIDSDARPRMNELIARTDGWRAASVTAQDYEQIAAHFRAPASMMCPKQDVVFDAFFYEDLYASMHGAPYAPVRTWEGLPDCLGFSAVPYTTDYRFAFWDEDSGLFVCYDETM